jgi:Holliday junction DNA helicase RuvA
VIASLAGTVAALALDSVILEVGGVGYRVYVSPSVLTTATPGGTLKLFTHHVVREDLQALYGFRSVEELTVTGVGPKVAMAIVGSRPTAELQLAIMQQDQAVLVTIPGIGKKLAERVIFELKEKVAAAGIAAADVAVAGMPASENDVIGALQALGYSLPEAREAARHGLQMAGAGASLEDRVKAALRVLVRD